eukprot:11116833-Ditylum_brightwellii.AAC.1
MLKEISTYVGRAFKYGGVISKSILKVSLVNIMGQRQDLLKHPADADSVEQRIWEKEVDEYLK